MQVLSASELVEDVATRFSAGMREPQMKDVYALAQMLFFRMQEATRSLRMTPWQARESFCASFWSVHDRDAKFLASSPPDLMICMQTEFQGVSRVSTGSDKVRRFNSQAFPIVTRCFCTGEIIVALGSAAARRAGEMFRQHNGE